VPGVLETLEDLQNVVQEVADHQLEQMHTQVVHTGVLLLDFQVGFVKEQIPVDYECATAAAVTIQQALLQHNLLQTELVAQLLENELLVAQIHFVLVVPFVVLPVVHTFADLLLKHSECLYAHTDREHYQLGHLLIPVYFGIMDGNQFVVLRV